MLQTQRNVLSRMSPVVFDGNQNSGYLTENVLPVSFYPETASMPFRVYAKRK